LLIIKSLQLTNEILMFSLNMQSSFKCAMAFRKTIHLLFIIINWASIILIDACEQSDAFGDAVIQKWC
jgi:hypothetical protein